MKRHLCLIITKKCYIICTKLKNLYYGGIIMIDIKFLRENPEIVKENIYKIGKTQKQVKQQNRENRKICLTL